MKRTIRTERQTIGILQVEKDHETIRGSFPRRGEAGTKCADLCLKHAVSEGPFYVRTAKYSGMAVSETGRPKALDDGNFRRKKLSAVQILVLAGMHELAARKWQRTP